MIMEYKRLTKRRKDGSVALDFYSDSQDFTIVELKLRLAELEDKIENGTFIEIPCIRKLNIVGIDCVEVVYIQHNGTIGECVCLNEAEAEKRLEDIRNETKSIDNSEK